MFVVKNGVIYEQASDYMLVNGSLCFTHLIFPERSLDEFNKNKYLTNKEVELFTRYKYGSDLSSVTEWAGYKLIDSEGNIFNGAETTFVETVKVTLVGYSGSAQKGSITIE